MNLRFNMILPILLVLFSVSSFVNAIGFHGFTFKNLEEPEPLFLNERNLVKERRLELPVDHFNHRDNRKWSMRYLENASHYKKNGPLLILLGGEWPISTGFLTGGLMYGIGSTHGAMMYYTEHRYYGKSRPTDNISTKNMQYLNVEQALADIAYFIEAKKKETGFENATVIVFGGSYAGNMAAWARLKYPHLIQGALASSAPVYAKADFYEYYEVVTKSLARYDRECPVAIKEAFAMVESLLFTEGGPEKLKQYFNMCDIPNVHSNSSIGFLMIGLAEVFASTVQYDNVENGRTKIAACCSNMTAKYLGSPLQRLARLVSKQDKCIEISYQKYLRVIKREVGNENSIMRQWLYQTCTEYGYYQTTNSKSVFGNLVTLSFFLQMCEDIYGEYYNGDFLNSRIERTNLMYGGIRPDMRNVIFTNGDIDPWHSLSVLRDLNEFSPAIVINGSSHCRDLYNDAPTDVEDLKKARITIRGIISDWISS